MKRKYYPLKPTKGKFREQGIAYLNVECTQYNEFICATGIDANGELWELDTPEQVAGYIDSLPSGAWIISYDADFIGSVFGALIEKFRKVEGYGADVYVFDVEDKERKWHIVDIYPFFGKQLEEIAEKIGVNFPDRPNSKKKTVWRLYSNARAATTARVWMKYCKAIKNAFGVFPSKSPGATALKLWRTTIDAPVFPKGKRTRKLAKAACMSGALHWATGKYEYAYLYDVNAAYPSVMRNTMYPTRVNAFAGHAPEEAHWLALVKVNYKSSVKFSPMAVRAQDSKLVLHPDEAYNTRIVMTYIDYEIMKKFGDLEIIEWIEGLSWPLSEEQDIFSAWANKVEAASSDSDSKALLKVSSRALHSKFAQNSISKVSRVVRLDNPSKLFEYRDGSIKDTFDLPDGGIAVLHQAKTITKFRPYWRPDWEAITQAACRRMLYDAIDENTVYCDTDGIISTVKRDDLSVGRLFGQWKLSEEGECAIIGPRWYSIGDKYKAAGLRAVHPEIVRMAIPQALTKNVSVEAIEAPSFSQVKGRQTVRRHTIKPVKYPHVLARGGSLFITRSPTVRSPIVYQQRILT